MTRQDGNALFLILIAIGLLGAATAMFTRSSSTTEDTGDYEQIQIQASEILRYAGSIEAGVQNLVQRGCSENQISFWRDSDGNGEEDASDEYYNDGAPADHSCHVFDPNGAGLSYMPVKSAWLDGSFSGQRLYGEWFFSDTTCVRNVGAMDEPGGCAATNSTLDLILFLPYLTKNLCQQIVMTLYNESTISVDQQDSYSLNDGYATGGFPSPGEKKNLSPEGNVAVGKNNLCYQADPAAISPAGDSHTFYQVLIPRG